MLVYYFLYVCMYVCMYVAMYVFMHRYMGECEYVSVYVYIYIYVLIYIICFVHMGYFVMLSEEGVGTVVSAYSFCIFMFCFSMIFSNKIFLYKKIKINILFIYLLNIIHSGTSSE